MSEENADKTNKSIKREPEKKRLSFIFSGFCFTKLIVKQIAGEFHRTEAGAAHTAEMCVTTAGTAECFVVHIGCSRGIHRQIELIVPAEFKTSGTHHQVANCCPGDAFGNVGGMSGNTENGQTFSDVVSIGKARCSFGVT